MVSLTKYEKLLVVIFLLTLPLCNPWVRGDGVGYYAFARAMLIEHRLDFTQDWLRANTSYRMGRVDTNRSLLPTEYTATGHLDNHFAVGPAILWSPFLIVAHAGTLLYDRMGGHVPADGFSRPYTVAMALGTAFYGFLAVVISFALARKYVSERWAFLAALGIWFGSSLPVYMYFNPSWSHAHSAFCVALFVWYWTITRKQRTWKEWLVLGAVGGLMVDVYLLNGALLLLPLLESAALYWNARKPDGIEGTRHLLTSNVLFVAALLVAFLPTMITKQIIYGSYLTSGYEHLWVWNSPWLLRVCFSADHGLFSWNPILVLAVAGLFCLCEYDRELGIYSIIVLAGLIYIIGCYQDWDGISSFGNRFLVSLTVLFVLGLGALFNWLGGLLRARRMAILTWSGTAAFVLWNLGLMFQWGMHLVPERGPISWRAAAHNQFAVVPEQCASAVKSYLTGRQKLMDRIEQEDVKQMKTQHSEGTE